MRNLLNDWQKVNGAWKLMAAVLLGLAAGLSVLVMTAPPCAYGATCPVGQTASFSGNITVMSDTAFETQISTQSSTADGIAFIPALADGADEFVMATTTATLGNKTIESPTLQNVTVTGGIINATTIGATASTTAQFSFMTSTAADIEHLYARILEQALNANSKAITNINVDSGAIDGTTIGASSPAAGSFTTVGGTTISASTVFKSADGAVGAPAYSYTSAPTTGWYLSGGAQRLSIGGTNTVSFSTTGISMAAANGVLSTASGAGSVLTIQSGMSTVAGSAVQVKTRNAAGTDTTRINVTGQINQATVEVADGADLLVRDNLVLRTIAGVFNPTSTAAIFFAEAGTDPVCSQMAGRTALYSSDVAGSAELFVKDESCTTTQLSNHPADFLNGLPLDCETPYAYSSEYPYLGKKVQVDMCNLVLAVQQMAAMLHLDTTQFMYVSDIQERNWYADQAMMVAQSVKDRNDTLDRIAEIQNDLSREVDMDKRDNLQHELDTITVPDIYVERDPDQWMLDRSQELRDAKAAHDALKAKK